MAGVLLARLPELGLWKVEDGRRRQGRRWELETLLTVVLLGILAGCKSLAEVEALTPKLSVGVRRRLRLPRFMPDTTLRDALVLLHPFDVREALHRLVKAAQRRQALKLVEDMPFHAVSMDGKWTSLPYWDNHYAQQQTDEEKRKAYGMVRTVTSVLVTSAAKVVLDAMPIPAETNEMGIFPHAFDALLRTYGDTVELFMYDAGAAGEENMAHVVQAGKHFLFCIADERWHLYQRTKELLGRLPASEVKECTEEILSKTNHKSLFRKLYVSPLPKGYGDFPHIRTLLRVQSQTVEKGVVIAEENRYFVSSKELTALTPKQWLSLIRQRWGVENNGHWTLDAIFKEDDKPWIQSAPRGTVVLMVLRRIAYDLLALFRCVTQKSEEKRAMPWQALLDWVYDTLIAVTDADLEGLRERKAPIAFS